jgi:hypothetical protein
LWRSYSIKISETPTPVNGMCGTANRHYSPGTTSYGSDTYCKDGNPSATPGFPTPENISTWYCAGINDGANSPVCEASVESSNATLTIVKGVGGSVKTSDGKINCGSSCSSDYKKNTSVVLTAYPDSTYWKFNGWVGDCAGTGQCVLNMNGPKTVKALFVARLFDYKEF